MSPPPPTSRRDALLRHDGYTIVELLVTILVVGVLAAIAIPQFLKQPDKGKDSAAESAARNLYTQVEACAVDTTPRNYTDCNTMAELGDPGDVDWGTGAGQVSVTASAASTHTITAVSQTAKGGTNSKFIITRAASGAVTRTCTTGGAGNEAGQCRSGVW